MAGSRYTDFTFKMCQRQKCAGASRGEGLVTSPTKWEAWNGGITLLPAELLLTTAPHSQGCIQSRHLNGVC